MRIRPIPLLALATLAACAARREPPPEPEPVPTPHPPPPVILSPPAVRPVAACVIRDGELTEIVFDYEFISGDSTYRGVPFSRAFPLDGQYAEPAGWFAGGEAIRFRPGPWFVKYGLPRELDRRDLVRVGEYRGVGVYAEVGQDASADVVYLPVRPGCIFQTYVPVAKME